MFRKRYTSEEFARQREQMVRRDIERRRIHDRGVLEAMRSVPREEFVPAKYQHKAYDDSPVPIGMGQTISQPYIVALMTEKLGLSNEDEVLEIGTGCGYQTAILAKIARRVFTIEKHNQLSEAAQSALGRLGIDNVEFYIGDGSCGWPRHRQFSRIIVTAAVPQIPEPLAEQLEEGGVIVAPVGAGDFQELIVGRKHACSIQQMSVCGVRFVNLRGEYGFPE